MIEKGFSPKVLLVLKTAVRNYPSQKLYVTSFLTMFYIYQQVSEAHYQVISVYAHIILSNNQTCPVPLGCV